MSATTLTNANSLTTKPETPWQILTSGRLLTEQERKEAQMALEAAREREWRRVKERLSSVPFYAEKAAKWERRTGYPDAYWRTWGDSYRGHRPHSSMRLGTRLAQVAHSSL